MISTNNITMQFGAKPLFENVSVKFGEGNRYGLIGANGSGKSTFMKILGGDLEQTSGEVAIEHGVRLGKLRQDQFAYEDMRVLDVVLMGHTEMWAAMTERDAIYANPEATEDDYMKAADLEAKFAEYDGYTAEARAAELLSGVGIEESLHNATMSEVAPGFKLRVLLDPGARVEAHRDVEPLLEGVPLQDPLEDLGQLVQGHGRARAEEHEEEDGGRQGLGRARGDPQRADEEAQRREPDDRARHDQEEARVPQLGSHPVAHGHHQDDDH